MWWREGPSERIVDVLKAKASQPLSRKRTRPRPQFGRGLQMTGEMPETQRKRESIIQ